MRRIYESDALHRDDDEPHSPSDLTAGREASMVTANQNRSIINWAKASHALMPRRLRDRAIEVTVETDRAVYGPEQPVGIRIRFRNRIPFPIAIPTPTRRRWDWAVDGKARAASEEYEPAPTDRSLLSFHRSETKVFKRIWHRRFRTAPDHWESASAGAHEISAFVAVENPAARGLQASTQIQLET